ncbi:MAG: TolC family protein [Crocinitomicaceae bacterium]|nr:TolC family protein [Crocinitomicaceae bacterium]
MPKVFIFLLLLILFPSLGFSQSWTLDMCLDSVINNNIELESERLSLDLAQIDINETKYRFIPSVNTGVTQGYNWGQTIDPFTNEFATDRVQFSNLFLSGDITLFSGLQTHLRSKINKLSLEGREIDIQIFERALKMDVVTNFFEILLNKSELEIYEKQVDLVRKQAKRIEILAKAGKIENGELYQINGELERVKARVIRSRNNLTYSKLLLQQLMNQPLDTSFVVIEQNTRAHINSPNVSSFPEIKQFTYLEELKMLELKQTKGRYLPNLALNGSIGSGYSGNNVVTQPNGQFSPKPFRDQLQDNFYQSVNLGLTIPIFSQYSVKSDILRREIELKKIKLSNTKLTNELSVELARLKSEISSTELELEVSRNSLKFAELNFKSVQTKYDQGAVNLDVLIIAQQSHLEAKMEEKRLFYLLEMNRETLNILCENN